MAVVLTGTQSSPGGWASMALGVLFLAGALVAFRFRRQRGERSYTNPFPGSVERIDRVAAVSAINRNALRVLLAFFGVICVIGGITTRPVS